jgi:hypothetical protein
MSEHEQTDDAQREAVADEELEQQDGQPLEDREVMTILPIEPTNPPNLPPVE